MSKMKQKYQTHDDRWFKDPEVVYPPSRTDPSQDISIDRLVQRHVRSGAALPVLAFGEDVRLEVHEIHERIGALNEQIAAEKKDLEAKDLEKRKLELTARQVRIRELVAQAPEYKVGSPELARLSAELTALLPGFEGVPPP